MLLSPGRSGSPIALTSRLMGINELGKSDTCMLKIREATQASVTPFPAHCLTSGYECQITARLPRWKSPFGLSEIGTSLEFASFVCFVLESLKFGLGRLPSRNTATRTRLEITT